MSNSATKYPGNGPDFAIVGASRSGTTSLHALLSQHPQLYMPAAKELQFFWRDSLYRKGTRSYERNFEAASEDQLKGEASPPYFYKGIRLSQDDSYQWDPSDDPAIRLAKTYPAVKIIISLRDPVTRAWSQFWKNKWQGRETSATIEAALDEELSGRRTPERDFFCWRYLNSYSIHVGHWLAQFPRSQVLVLIFEEWIRNPDIALRQIEQFLEIESHTYRPVSGNQKNRGRAIRNPVLSGLANLEARIPGVRPVARLLATKNGYPKLERDTQARLEQCFRPDIERLEHLITRPLNIWTNRHG